MMPTHKMLTRRTFLYRSSLCWSAIALGPLACAQRSSCSTFEIGANMPARLLFPADAKATGAARLNYLTCVDEASDVLLRFSDGRTLRSDKGLSFSSRIAQRGGMADRAAVAMKVVAAYALEKLGQILQHAWNNEILRLASTGRPMLVPADAPLREQRLDDEYRPLFAARASLRDDFDVFQEQAVLDTVTMGAVYDLALALDGDMHNVSHITWNTEDRQFVFD